MKERLTIEEARKAFRGGAPKRKNPPQWKVISCAICGEPISVLTRRTKYCSDCRKKANKQRQDDMNHKVAEERRSARMEKEKKKKKQKPHVSQIDKLARAALAAGMSYGRYVAMKGAGRI